jgi:hypothetical protein
VANPKNTLTQDRRKKMREKEKKTKLLEHKKRTKT